MEQEDASYESPYWNVPESSEKLRGRQNTPHESHTTSDIGLQDSGRISDEQKITQYQARREEIQAKEVVHPRVRIPETKGKSKDFPSEMKQMNEVGSARTTQTSRIRRRERDEGQDLGDPSLYHPSAFLPREAGSSGIDINHRFSARSDAESQLSLPPGVVSEYDVRQEIRMPNLEGGRPRRFNSPESHIKDSLHLPPSTQVSNRTIYIRGYKGVPGPRGEPGKQGSPGIPGRSSIMQESLYIDLSSPDHRWIPGLTVTPDGESRVTDVIIDEERMSIKTRSSIKTLRLIFFSFQRGMSWIEAGEQLRADPKKVIMSLPKDASGMGIINVVYKISDIPPVAN